MYGINAYYMFFLIVRFVLVFDYLYNAYAYGDHIVQTALCYGRPSKHIPAHCACETPFTVDHAVLCLKGGLLSVWRNEIKNLTATLLTEVC